MKIERRKISVIVLLALLTLVALSSCNFGGLGDNGLPKGDYIYAPGSDISVVSNVSTESAVEIAGKIASKIGAIVPVVTDSVKEGEHEILLGRTNRELSEKAYRALSRIREDEGDLVGYVVYSDGNSIAIAYDNDIFDTRIAEIRAAEYFIGTFVDTNDTLKISSGKLTSLAFDPIEYLEDLQDEEQELKWAEFEEKLSKITDNASEIVDAYRIYYSQVCTDDVVYWLADLYDKDLGGFYFSNSGRDNYGFLPDIESTSQAVGFYKSTGMILHDVDFPDWFAKEIVAFTKGLQEPDGYFYHPQWDRATLAANTQRMGRDLNSAEGLLERFWSAPTYDTPNGTKGDGILPDGTPVGGVAPTAALTGRLGGSAVSAVSAVIPTATIDGFAMLESVDAFETYLDELAARNKLSPTDSKYRSFYQIANEITTFSSQLVAKDESIGRKVYSDILINWLNEHQDKETGLFDEGLSFANTNAYYKAINVYNRLGYPVPLADKVVESTVEILMNADNFDCILNTFNIWGSLNQTRKNLEQYAKSEEATATLNAMRAKLLELAPEAVRATANAQLLFKQPDGSFSYLIGNNTSVSQMMKVAVPNTCEGDVNSTTLTMGGILHGMLETMGIKGIAPTCFTEADGMRCFLRMSKLGTIIKKDPGLDVVLTNFDDEEVGSSPTTGLEFNLDGGTVTVVEAPRPGEKDNKAVEFDTALKYESLSVPTSSVTPSSTCYVFEGDFCVPEDTADGEMQILMQNAIYMTTINKVGNEVRVWESSSRKPAFAKKTELDASVKAGEWFNLKMEFYPGDMNTVRAKIYFNGKLVAVTDNYFDDTGAKLSGDIEPRNYYEFVNIIAVSTCDMTILLDNIAAYATGTPYEVEHGVAINIDAPENESVIHSFDESALPEGFIVSENSGSVSVTDSFDKTYALSLTGGGKGTVNNKNGNDQFVVELPINCVASGSRMRTAVFESDVYISASESDGTKLRIHLLENDSERESMASFDLVLSGSEVKIVPSSDGTTSTPLSGISIPAGQKFKLRLEYYEHEFATLVYIDGVLLAMSKDTSTTASRSSAGLLELTSATDAGGTVLLDNLKFEKDEIDFITSVTPKDESVIHDFSSLDVYTTLSGGAVIDGGSVNMADNGAKIDLELTDRGVVSLAARVTADVILSERPDGAYRFSLNAQDGTPVIAFDAVIKGNSVAIREYYAGGTGTTLSKTVVKGSRFVLTFKYYFEDRMAEIFVDGVHVATNTLTYLFSNDNLEITNATVTKVDGTGAISLDNLIAENTLDFALGSTAEDGVMAPENGNDFEHSYSGNPAAGIIYEPISVGAQLGVKGIETGKDSEGNPVYSKFLAIKTLPGGNDGVRFPLSSNGMVSEIKSAVVEADVYLACDTSQASSAVEFYLFAGDGKTMAWYSSVTFKSGGGSVTVSDYNSNVGASVSGDRLATEGKVFKLRLEYALTEKGMTVNMFVDGEYICSSTNMHKALEAPISPANISGFRVYTANASSGYVLLDNVNIYHSDTVTELPEGSGSDESVDESEYHYNFTGKDWKFIQPTAGYMAHTKLTGVEEAATNRNYGGYSFEKSGDPKYGDIFRMYHNADDYNFAMLIHFPVQELDENANCLVFEFDMKLASGFGCYSDTEASRKAYSAMILSWNGADLTTVASKTTSTAATNALFKRNINLIDSDGVFETKTIETSSGTQAECRTGGDTLRFDGVSAGDGDISMGEWHEIKYEIYTDVKKIVYYVDDVRVAETDYTGDLDISSVKTNSLQFEPRFREVEASFDNILSAKIAKAYSAE